MCWFWCEEEEEEGEEGLDDFFGFAFLFLRRLRDKLARLLVDVSGCVAEQTAWEGTVLLVTLRLGAGSRHFEAFHGQDWPARWRLCLVAVASGVMLC